MSNELEITGTEKVAAFLLSLEREDALELMRHLDAELVASIASAMTELGDKFADRKDVDALYASLSRAINLPHAVVPQSDRELRLILEEAFGADRASEVLDEIRQRQLQEQPFCDVEQFHPSILAVALRDESPTSAAIVLSHIDPALSAEAIGHLSPEFALEAVTQMATLMPPGTSALKSMARNLVDRLRAIARQPKAPDSSMRLQTIAEMLNFSSAELERSVMEGIEAKDADMAEEIREFMFTWVDLAGVDKRSMQKILGSVDTRTLAISLKACAADVEENITENLSSRVKTMVIEERELAGPVPMSEVLAARTEILKAVHTLIDAGDFQPARSGEEIVS
jgi:flagellar motor switch protein FliG